jgi:thioredoxin-like negative regulator of GroEL
MKLHTFAVAAIVLLLSPVAVAQTEGYSPIRTLENAVEAGTATRAQELELGRLYLSAGRAYEARNLADRVLTAEPGNADAAQLRERAVADLRVVTDRSVADAETQARTSGATDADRLALADAYFAAGRYREAADTYRALPRDMRSREIRLRQARALSWGRQTDEAEMIYADLLAEERTPELELEYGRLLSWMGASDLSVDNLRRAHERLNTEDSAIALANAYAWDGNRQEAISLLSRFTAANENAREASQLLSEMQTSPYLQLEQLDRRIAVEPHNLAFRLQRARMLYDMREYGEARRTIRFIRENSDEDLPEVAELERQLDQYREQELARLDARRTGSMTSASEPSDQLSLAKAYAGIAAYDRAIPIYKDYLSTHPDDLETRIAYARVLNWDRRYNEAQRQYERILEERPDRADLRLEYAQTLSWNREFTPAMQTFSSLTDISDNPRARLYSDVPARAHFNRGQIYRWFGWNDHALREQNAAITLDSSYGPAALELDRIRQLRPSSGLEARYSTSTDSNDFTLRRYDLTGDLWTSRTTAFSASIGRHSFERIDQQVDATAVSGGIRHRLSDRLLARGRVGANLYTDDLGTRPFWGIGAEYRPNLQSRFALDYNRYDLVYDVFTLQSLGGSAGTPFDLDPVSINDFRAHYDHNTGGHWSWLVDTSYGFISDDNNRLGAHGLLTYRILNAPFVAIKADGRYLSYDFRTNRYWSPENYRSFSGILQVGQNLDWLEWSVEGRVGRSFDRGRSSDIRGIGVNLAVPVTESIDIIGDWSYGKSGRFDNVFGEGDGDFTNYWRRSWFVGVRLNNLFGSGGRARPDENYYFDNRPATSPVVPSITGEDF